MILLATQSYYLRAMLLIEVKKAQRDKSKISKGANSM